MHTDGRHYEHQLLSLKYEIKEQVFKNEVGLEWKKYLEAFFVAHKVGTAQ